jgi:hypothetical protein
LKVCFKLTLHGQGSLIPTMGITREELSVMALTLRALAASSAAIALACGTLAAGPAQAVEITPEYVESVGDGVTIQQILAAGDQPGDGNVFEGIPDGMGAIKNKNGTFTIFISHEQAASDTFVASIERHYGGFGTTISAVRFDPETNTVLSVKDAFKTVKWYDYAAGKFGTEPTPPADAAVVDTAQTPNHTTGLNRFGAATMAKAGDLRFRVNNKTYGINDPILLTGESGSDESRVFALNPMLQRLRQVPALGLGSTENIVLVPASKTRKKTVAFIGENGDVIDSQLFMYAGDKHAKGTWLRRAGLVDGKKFVASISNSGSALADDVKVRTALAKKTISTAVRQAAAIATTKVAVSSGTLTVTTASAHNLKVGDEVTLSSFGAVGGINLGSGASNINGVDIVRTVTSTTFTIGVDADDLSETNYTDGRVAPAADVVVITTSANHGLLEGDRVRVEGNSDLAGLHIVTGAPSNTVFTVSAAGGALSTTGGTVGEMLNVDFRAVPTDIAGDAQQVVARLRGTEFSKVKDLFVNPANPNELFFVTAQSDSDTTTVAGVKETGRDGGALWKVTFINVNNPEAGAFIELILEGTEYSESDGIKINRPDNITMTDDGTVLLIQEDPGALSHVARVLALRLSDKKLVTLAQFDADYVTRSNTDTYLSDDEETSGIFDATGLYDLNDGADYFFFSAQLHPATKSGGANYGTDPLRALQVALARPDLIAQTSYDITNINRASGTATSITITLDSVGELAVNDVMHIYGASTEINGSYAITAVNGVANTVTATVLNSLTLSGDLNAGNSGLTANARLVTVDGTEALALKASIIEAGGLYTMRITDWDDVFDVFFN